MSFNPEVERDARPGVMVLGDLGASSSRYADPDAEGVTPVFKTKICYFLPLSPPYTWTYTSFEEHLELLFSQVDPKPLSLCGRI